MDALEIHVCSNEGIGFRSYAVVGRSFQLGGLYNTYRACANVSDFSTFNNIVQCPHNFGPRRFPIHSVNLQDIDVGAETCHACINGIEDVLAGKPDLIDSFPLVGALSTNSWLTATRINTKVAFA